MASQIQDRWLWMGFGVALYLAAYGIRYALQDVVHLTAIDLPVEQKDEDSSNNPEDAIGLDTLKTLCSSTNPNIANAAKSIVVNRYARLPNAYDMLSHDALSSNTGLQQQARWAIRYLRHWPAPEGIDSLGPGAWTPGNHSHDNENGNEVYLPAPEMMDVDESVAGWTNIPRERGGPALGSELERRRRRREAMVFREADGQAEEEDIIRLRS